MRPSSTIVLKKSEDLARLRRRLGGWLDQMSAEPLVRTQILTAATELGRNVIRHGGGGWVTVAPIERAGRRGLRFVFEDEGPGISNFAEAFRDGFSTAGGLGMGLGGSRRLLGELDVEAREPRGLRVQAVGWVDPQ